MPLAAPVTTIRRPSTCLVMSTLLSFRWLMKTPPATGSQYNLSVDNLYMTLPENLQEPDLEHEILAEAVAHLYVVADKPFEQQRLSNRSLDRRLNLLVVGGGPVEADIDELPPAPSAVPPERQSRTVGNVVSQPCIKGDGHVLLERMFMDTELVVEAVPDK